MSSAAGDTNLDIYEEGSGRVMYKPGEMPPHGDGEGSGAGLLSMLGGGEKNVSEAERAVSLLAGGIIAGLGLTRRTVPGYIAAGIGAALAHRGLTGHCAMYSSMGVNTAEASQTRRDPVAAGRQRERRIESKGVHVTEAFLIGKPAEELYSFWRNFENLPRIMPHLQRVTVIDSTKSHWVAKAPSIAAPLSGEVSWDAEITRDEPNALISWRSLPGSTVDNAGTVRFSQAMGDRGTIVNVTLSYVPPAGKLGHAVAKLFGRDAAHEAREGLRSFKRYMETGEVPTTEGQPRGTCTGQGKYEGA